MIKLHVLSSDSALFQVYLHKRSGFSPGRLDLAAKTQPRRQQVVEVVSLIRIKDLHWLSYGSWPVSRMQDPRLVIPVRR